MLALLEDIDGVDRCSPVVGNDYFSEGSDAYTIYNSPASSCIEDYNVAAEVEISRDISDHQEYSFYDQCLTNLEADLKSSEAHSWANLADLGDTITEFSLNECRNRQTEAEFSQCESVCSDDYWNRCNLWVNSTCAEVEVTASEEPYRNQPGTKSKRKCSNKTRRNLETLSWNEMTVTEQRGTIENLTQVVSSTMGLREQLDVIRILNPKAVVSATDTEFEIDLELLNGDKLEKIREYVKRHEIQTVKTAKNGISSPIRKTKRKGADLHHRRKGQLKASKEENALLSRVYKQLLKEKKSGLFHNEQVISISKAGLQGNKSSVGDDKDDDEMEIDILD